MELFSIIFGKMEILVVYIIMGIIAVKSGLFDKDTLNHFSKYVLKMALPIMIFANCTYRISADELPYVGAVLVVMAVMYIIIQIVTSFTIKKFGLTGEKSKLYRALSTFGNDAFIGFPIILAAYPETGIFYVSLFTVVDLALLWTWGMKLTTPEEKFEKVGIAGTLKRFLNPAFIAVVLGIIRMITDFPLPEVVDTALTNVGATASPVSMIYIGGILCFSDLKQYLKRTEYYLVVLVKMIIIPIVLFVLMTIFGLKSEMAASMALLAGLPTVLTLVMMTDSNGSDKDYILGGVLVTTIASIVTMPFVSFVIGRMM